MPECYHWRHQRGAILPLTQSKFFHFHAFLRAKFGLSFGVGKPAGKFSISHRLYRQCKTIITSSICSSLDVLFQCVPRVRTCRRVRGSSARACRVPSVLTVMRWEPKAARTARCGGRPLLCQWPPPSTVVSSTSYLFPKWQGFQQIRWIRRIGQKHSCTN